MKSTKLLIHVTAAFAMLCAGAAIAGDKTKSTTINCATTSLADEIGKLDRSIANIVEFEGDCVEDIVIDGHRDLTLRGLNGASITATVIDLSPSGEGNSTIPLAVYRSTVTVESISFNGGSFGVMCSNRSDCIFRDISIHGGWNGLALQTQASAELFGSGIIEGSQGIGIGVFGASNLTVSPNWYSGYNVTEYATTVSGHGWTGVLVQDGSFYRSDNAVYSGNWIGVTIRRGSVAKLYAGNAMLGIHDNFNGVDIHSNTTADVDTPIKNNTTGLRIGALSSVNVRTNAGQFASNDNDFDCYDDTAKSNVCSP